MVHLLDLPIELLSQIVDAVGGDTSDEEVDRGLSLQHRRLALTPRPDVDSLRALRTVCRMFSKLCSPHLYRVVRLLPTVESAARYTEILESDTLTLHVNKVVFQTRLRPEYDMWTSGEDYEEPLDFFQEAMGKVGRFPNLTAVELGFSSGCSVDNKDWYDDMLPEQVEFRIEVLQQFFAGLNDKDHPATGVRDLSIKNLQCLTPTALTSTTESKFKTDFQQVMSRVRQLSLQIATEDNDAAPERSLNFDELHDFFGTELEKYWLGPIKNQLIYLKLYAGEVFWGFYPRSNISKFPNLRTMVLGNMTFTHDAQLDWILSHADTLEELILDDCPIVFGGHMSMNDIDTDRHIIRGEISENVRVGDPNWSYEARCHHHFDKIRTGLPKLKKFAYGHGDWHRNRAYEEADALTSQLRPSDDDDSRYKFFKDGSGPSPWVNPDSADDYLVEAGGPVERPDCDEEDQRALDELLKVVRLRK